MEVLLEKIYESSNATVYKKTDADGHSLAIKVLKTDISNPRQILQFNNEFTILTELDIPGVRKVLSKGIHEGLPSITSTYFEGVTLASYLKQFPFHLRNRLQIATHL